METSIHRKPGNLREKTFQRKQQQWGKGANLLLGQYRHSQGDLWDDKTDRNQGEYGDTVELINAYARRVASTRKLKSL